MNNFGPQCKRELKASASVYLFFSLPVGQRISRFLDARRNFLAGTPREATSSLFEASVCDVASSVTRGSPSDQSCNVRKRTTDIHILDLGNSLLFITYLVHEYGERGR